MSSVTHVGKKIAGLREIRNISREELSERSGIATDVLSAIEEGSDPPALSALIRVARALGVRLGTFLDDATIDAPVVTRNSQRKSGMNVSGRSAGANPHLAFFSLASGKAGRHFEPFVIDIDPSSGEDLTPSSHEGEEFLYVLQGEVEILYGRENYRLNAGDSIYYDSVIDHHVHAGGNGPAKILAVVYVPL